MAPTVINHLSLLGGSIFEFFRTFSASEVIRDPSNDVIVVFVYSLIYLPHFFPCRCCTIEAQSRLLSLALIAALTVARSTLETYKTCGGQFAISQVVQLTE